MYLIEILLPVRDNEGRPFAARTYQALRDELIDLYGGVTSFTRAPAQGETKCGDEKVRDDIIVLEVMTEDINRPWWASYRKKLGGFSCRTKSWFARPGSKYFEKPKAHRAFAGYRASFRKGLTI